VVGICDIVPFLERFFIVKLNGLRRMSEFIELYKTKEIIWDPKQPMHFNKIKKIKMRGRNWEKK
jgi:hypothetical protein